MALIATVPSSWVLTTADLGRSAGVMMPGVEPRVSVEGPVSVLWGLVSVS